MKHVLLALSLFVSPAISAQKDSLFEKLNQAQALRLLHFDEETRDSAFTVFDAAFARLAQSGKLCGNLPKKYMDSRENERSETDGMTKAYALMNGIMVTSLPGIKVFSWDDLGGGSYHTYTNFISYSGPGDSCITMPFDTTQADFGDGAEAGYYQLERLKTRKGEYYLLLGYGTFGGGMHHYVARILQKENGIITECTDCYPEKKYIRIECNRGQEPDLKYDPKKQTLSYKQYEMDEDIGFYKEEFRIVTFDIVEGKLVERK